MEVAKLVNAGILHETFFPTMIANLVVVKKKGWKLESVHRLFRSKHGVS